jgi:hypothetical protein
LREAARRERVGHTHSQSTHISKVVYYTRESIYKEVPSEKKSLSFTQRQQRTLRSPNSLPENIRAVPSSNIYNKSISYKKKRRKKEKEEEEERTIYVTGCLPT